MRSVKTVRCLEGDKGFYRKVIVSIHKLESPRLSRIVNSVWRETGDTNEQLKVGNALGITCHLLGQTQRWLY